MSIVIVNVLVPSSGDGPIANIADLIGEKTVELSGYFEGRYTLMGSQDDINFVPVLTFDSDGKENIKLSLPLALKSVRVRSGAINPIGVTMNVSGLNSPGTNSFAAVGTFAAGSSGAQFTMNLLTTFPPIGLESDIGILCSGSFTGLMTVAGSLDGINFNPLGGFRSDTQSPSLLGTSPTIEFSPLLVDRLIQYIRVSIAGTVSSNTVVTVGGAIRPSGNANTIPAQNITPGLLQTGLSQLTTAGGIIPSPPTNDLLVTVDAGGVVNGMKSAGLQSGTWFYIEFTNACQVVNKAVVGVGEVNFYIHASGTPFSPVAGGRIVVRYLAAGLTPWAPCLSFFAPGIA